MACLIKPQFECGKKDIGKGGIVRDKKVQTRVKEEIRQCALDSGFDVAGLIPSPISGGSGNTEYLIALDNKNN